jgi:hypothetical protein
LHIHHLPRHLKLWQLSYIPNDPVIPFRESAGVTVLEGNIGFLFCLSRLITLDPILVILDAVSEKQKKQSQVAASLAFATTVADRTIDQ